VQATSREFLKLAPDVVGLESLGVTELVQLFESPPRTLTAARIHRCGPHWVVPLPGTPDEAGVQHEKPRGSGTGLLHLRAFPAAPLASLGARLTHPRSTSLAARTWNLICHLQAHGIAAPQLVALAERRRGFGVESLVITRELEGFVSASEFFRTQTKRSERRRAVHSLALACTQLWRSGTRLPSTAADNLLIQRDDEDCVALKIVNLQSEQSLLRERGLARTRLPAIAFTSFDGGSIVREVQPREREQLLVRLSKELGESLTRRERLEWLARLGYSRASAAALAARCR
jgi:hypothetical protein